MREIIKGHSTNESPLVSDLSRAYLALGRYQEQRIALMQEFVEQKIAEGRAGP